MRTRRNVSSSDPVLRPEVVHQSVLLHEAIELLALEPHHVVLDATVGGAGHTRAMAAALGSTGTIVGLDQDTYAIERAQKALVGVAPQVRLAVANFRNAHTVLPSLGVPALDRALFDLGWSAYQLADGRGFSFMTDEPLLMTYRSHPEADDTTAYDIVNTWEEEHLADIIFGWGEERFARRIAKTIVAHRAHGPITTARELAEIISHAVPGWYRHKKIHPATKTFQALRIAVNDEFGAIREGCAGVRSLMRPGGRIAVITFHSLEDRVVKNLFRSWQEEGVGTSLTKKPVTPSARELKENPRARSAKLRVFVFLK